MKQQIIRYWGRKPKDLANRYIQLYSRPNDIVADLFGGTGVFVQSALELGRRAIYIDLNPFAELIARVLITGCNTTEFRNAAQKILAKEKIFIKLNGNKTAINPRTLFFVKCDCGEEIEAKSVTFTRFYQVGKVLPRQLKGNRGKIYRTIYDNGIISHETLLEIHRDIKTQSLSNALKHLIKEKLINEEARPITAHLLRPCRCGLTKLSFSQSNIWVVEGNIKPAYWYPKTSLDYGKGMPFLKKRDVSQVDELFLDRSIAILSAIWHEILLSNVSKKTKDCLKLTFMATLARSSKMCRSSGGTWPINSYWVPRIFVVKNPYVAFENAVKRMIRYLENSHKFKCGSIKEVIQNHANVAFKVEDSTKISLPRNSIDYVIIDPPHTDETQFFELSLFYTSWLRKKLDFEGEVVINKNQGKTLEDYMDKLKKVSKKVYAILKKEKFFTIVLHEEDKKILNQCVRIICHTGFKLASKEQVDEYQVYTFKKI